MNPLFFFCGIGLLSMSVGAAVQPTPDLQMEGAAPMRVEAPHSGPTISEDAELAILMEVVEPLNSRVMRREMFSRRMLPSESRGRYSYRVVKPESASQGPIAFELTYVGGPRVLRLEDKAAKREPKVVAIGRIDPETKAIELAYPGAKKLAWISAKKFVAGRNIR